jgi:hypothetical protein
VLGPAHGGQHVADGRDQGPRIAATGSRAAQQEHRLTDLGPLEEALAALEDVGHADVGQRRLVDLGLGVDPEQHRHLGRRHPGVDQGLALRGHCSGLGGLVGVLGEGRLAGVGALTEQPQTRQPLALGGLTDQPVGQPDDLGGRSVVPFELDHGRVGVAVGEAQQVVGVGPGERVDGLVRVADDADLGPPTQPGVEQPLLQRVDVLVLVDDEVAVLRPHLPGHRRVLLDRVGGDQQEVLEVQGPVPLLGRLVAGVHRGHGSRLEGRLPAGRLRAGRVVVRRGQRGLGPLDLTGQVTQAGAVGGQPGPGGSRGHQAELVLDQ